MVTADAQVNLAVVSSALLESMASLAEGQLPADVLQRMQDLPNHPSLDPLRILARTPDTASRETLVAAFHSTLTGLETGATPEHFELIDQMWALMDCVREPATEAVHLSLHDPATPLKAAQSLAAQPVVLVVDDEATIVELETLVLERGGYRVFKTLTGEEALAVFEAHREEIDVVITDMILPKMTGIELIAKLRALKPGLAVVLASGGDLDPSAWSAMMAQGVRVFLSKPFSLSAVAAAVKSALAMSESPETNPDLMTPDRFVEKLPERLTHLTQEDLVSLLHEMTDLFRHSSEPIDPALKEHPLVRIHDTFINYLENEAAAHNDPLWYPAYPAFWKRLVDTLKAESVSLAAQYIEDISSIMWGIRDRVDHAVPDEEISRYVSAGVELYSAIMMAEIIYRMACKNMEGVPDLHNIKNRAQALIANAHNPDVSWKSLVLRRPQGMSLSTLVAHWITGMKALAAENNVELSFEMSGLESSLDSAEELTESQRDYLEATIEELILNSAHHGSTRVTVEMIRHEDYVTLKVSDDGDGMSLEKVIEIRRRQFQRVRPGGSVTGWGGGIRELLDRLPVRWHLSLASREKPATDHGTRWVLTIRK